MRDQIFISYSHLDDVWRQRLVTHLTPWVRKKKFDPWDDKRIPPGAKWYQQIVEALDQSSAAILLVTPNFLQSEFIDNEEVATILRTAETKGLRIFWIYVSSCAYRASLLRDYQAVNDTSRPLDLLPSEGQINAELARICETLASQFPDEPPKLADSSVLQLPPLVPNGRPHVVLLYKRNSEADEQVMALIKNSVASQGMEVFVDRDVAIGREWVKEIEAQLKHAEAVIPLISEVSVKSEMLTLELQIAQEAAREQQGRPRILPVRIRYTDVLPLPIAAILDPLQYFHWNGPSDNLSLISAISKGIREKESATPKILPAPGGGLLPSSDIYIYRTQDEDFQDAIIRQESIVLLKGSRQVGKTSMLARGLETARGTSANVVITDFEILSGSELETLNSLFLALADWIQESLSADFASDWKSTRSPQRNFERFLQNVLNGTDKPLVWAMDEVDKVFAYPYAGEFFGAIRSWHNLRALEPQKPWSRLTAILSYATEASLFIPDLNQSPFNVGTRLSLSDFSEQQVLELNKKFGEPIDNPEALRSFYELIGGHPYLANRGLQILSMHPQSITAFSESADREDGPYGDHLRRYLMLLGRDESLWDALAAFTRKVPLENKTFIRLRAGGLLKGNTPQEAEIRCKVYEKYILRHFGMASAARA